MGSPLDELVEVRGARLRVRTAGRGPAVLLIHGWAIDLDMWTPQFVALADRYRLIAFDRRGFGRSTGRASLDRDLADIEELLAKLEVDSAAIVGMSQGARVALRWAMYSPDTTQALILDGPPQDLLAPGRPQGEITLSTYRKLVRDQGIDAFRREWLDHPLMRLYTTDSRAHALLHEMVGRYPGQDLLTDEMQHLDMPILIINGEYDTTARLGAGAELVRTLPHAQLAIIPEAGHLSNLDNPGAWNQALDQFLAASHRPHRSTCHAE